MIFRTKGLERVWKRRGRLGRDAHALRACEARALRAFEIGKQNGCLQSNLLCVVCENVSVQSIMVHRWSHTLELGAESLRSPLIPNKVIFQNQRLMANISRYNYFPGRLQKARLVNILFYGTLAINFTAFENKIYTANDCFHRNVPYGKIQVKEGPIGALGVTSRLPYHIINSNITRA